MQPPAWTDAHCHLQDPAFAENLKEVLDRSRTFSVRRWIVNSTSPADWSAVARLADTVPGVQPQFGVHPWHADSLPDDWESQLTAWLLRVPSAGVGEIGLDAKWSPLDIGEQMERLENQLMLADRLQRPCTLHVVGAWSELHRVLDRVCPERCLLHRFSGSAEQAATFSRRGFWFSFGADVMRPSAAAKTASILQAIAPDRLLLETDSPYQHPAGKSHHQEPAGLLQVAETVAGLLRIPVDQLREQTESNARSLFDPVDFQPTRL
jgi:TatD DNase family protein